MSGASLDGLKPPTSVQVEDGHELPTLLRIPDVSQPSSPVSPAYIVPEPDSEAIVETGRIANRRRGVPDLAQFRPKLLAIGRSLRHAGKQLPRQWTSHLLTIATIAAAIIACTLIARAMKREDFQDLTPNAVAGDQEIDAVRVVTQRTETGMQDRASAADEELTSEVSNAASTLPQTTPAPTLLDAQANAAERLPQIEPTDAEYPPPLGEDLQTIDLRVSPATKNSSTATTAESLQLPTFSSRWDSQATGKKTNDTAQQRAVWERPVDTQSTRTLPESAQNTGYPTTNPVVYQTLDEIRSAMTPTSVRRSPFDPANSEGNQEVQR